MAVGRLTLCCGFFLQIVMGIIQLVVLLGWACLSAGYRSESLGSGAVASRVEMGRAAIGSVLVNSMFLG